MSSLSAEEKIEFLLQVLATGGEFSVDYGALAKKMGINTNSNAQRRLKSIVEGDKRFVLRSSGGTARVIKLNEADDTKIGPISRKRAQRSTSGKGRKHTKNSDVDDEEGSEIPPKMARKSKKDHVKATGEKGFDHGRADRSLSGEVI